MSHPGKMGYPYYSVCCLRFYWYRRKRVCARASQTDGRTLGEEGGSNGGSRERRESGEKTQRKRSGGKAARSGAFLLNSSPRKPWTRAPRFLPKPEGKPRFCVNYRRKINEDPVGASSPPVRAAGTLHFAARTHSLSASLGAADLLLSLKNRKRDHLCFLMQPVPLHGLLQELPRDLAQPV